MNVTISKEEWAELCSALLDHHSLFYKIGEMGRPCLTDSIPTACVTFDKNGNFINFLFNPEFWSNSSFYEKIFVLCHECLHLILRHGHRFKDSKDNLTANYAMDIVVNHSLVNRFGFIRENIKGWEELCWVDTIFKNKKINNLDIPQDETAEYYLNLIKRVYSSDKNFMQKLVDSHEFGEVDDKELFAKLNEELSQEEKESIKKFYGKHSDKTTAGSQSGNILHFSPNSKITVKKKWESVVKKWSQSRIISTDKDNDQWARKHRRFMFLETGFFLPSEFEVEDFDLEKGKLKVLFFLDASGSCWHLKDRFFAAAESLPKKHFDVDLFSFDTQVFTTDFKQRKIKGGGGTSFSIIENYIQNNYKDKYPEGVWIMTDGYGDTVNPAHPENWFWFLSQHSTSQHIPKNSTKFDLEDFV